MSAPTPSPRARLLCVDDEPRVVEGLALTLGRRFEVATATSGQAALDGLRPEALPAVVISDMRMPGMSGAAFLARMRVAAPDAVRVLLTGQADMPSAIEAVNDGQVFRFLTKPCPPAVLLGAVEAALAQHRLVTAERVLLEDTLHGTVKMLTDILALTNPVSFGRAVRVKKLVSDLATRLELTARWQVEVAAMLSQLGHITLPGETVEKLHAGQALTEREQGMVNGLPALTEQLLGNIPRLEVVRGILAGYPKPPVPTISLDPEQRLVELGRSILRAALDFDALEERGRSPGDAVAALREEARRYEPRVLEALAAVRGPGALPHEVQVLPLAALRPGMVFAEDLVQADSGRLLLSRGHEATLGLLTRIGNFPAGTVREPIKVLVKVAARAAAGIPAAERPPGAQVNGRLDDGGRWHSPSGSKAP